MELSVIILSYNVRPYVWQCIDSVLAATQGITAEIILVDNDSQDDTIDLISKEFPQVKLLPNSENIGFAKAYNQAVKQAQGAYICILNPDTVLGETVFKSILKMLKGQDQIGAVGTQFIDGRGCFLPECKRVVPTPWGSLKKLLGFANQKSVYYQDDLERTQEGYAAILAGAFLFIKKEDYQSVEGFDEHYFMFGEDIDFSYKLLKNGKKNYYLGGQTILHYKGESTQKNRQYLERFYGAMVHFYKTHFSESKINVFAVSLLAQLLIWWRGLLPVIKNKSQYAVESVLWVSEANRPEDTVANWMQKKARLGDKSTFEVQTPEQFLMNQSQKALVVFDRGTLSYGKIIELMTLGASNGQFFRIWHRDKNLLIGSDSSDAHGEALILRSE